MKKRHAGRALNKLRVLSKTRQESKPAKKRSAGSILEAVRGELRRMVRNGAKIRKNSKKWVPVFIKPALPSKPERQHLPTKAQLEALDLAPMYAPRDEIEENMVFLKKAAHLGDLDAQSELGIRLASGLGVIQESSQGVAWLHKAASAGHAYAQHALGFIYDEGVLVGRNLKTAINWYQKAAEHGNPEARYNLAKCQHLLGNHKEAFRLWNENAETQDHRSLNNIGTYLAQGIAVAKDNHAAAELFRRAQKNGYMIADYNLGICYELGEGVGQSNANAQMLIESAARRGYAQAQYHISDCYLTGRTVGTKDHSLALKWLNMAREGMAQREVFNKTYSLDLRLQGSPSHSFRHDWAKRMAERGDVVAQCYLGLCYAYGTRETAKDYPQSVMWLTMAAMSDNATAQYALGCLHHRGLGTKRDTQRAAEWHRLAAINGIKQSLLITANNYQRGNGVAKDEIQAYAYYCAADKSYKLAFLDKKKYEWKDFAAGERAFHALTKEIDAKRKT
jgi:TPR repeat protein